MYTLVMFGMVVERVLGTKKFLILYFVTGLGAVALHTGVEWLEVRHLLAVGDPSAQVAYTNVLRTPMVGASGAIYGLLMSYALLYPQNRLTLIFPPISMKAMTWVIIFGVIELFVGIRGVADGVAHFAHLGGMLFGWLMIRYWKKKGTLFNEYGQY
jgi:membrane associated rhomboid family serine protease